MLTGCSAKQLSWKCTLILVIRLCISVQIAIQQSKRSHDDGSTVMGSAQNDIIRNKAEIFPLDYITRGWQTFDNWKINEPQLFEYGKIAYSVKIGNQSQHHLLISGADISKVFENWLYTVNTNSWQKVDNGDYPRTSRNPFMVQLCSNIFAFDLYLATIYSISTKAWIFDTVLLNWKKTQVDGNIHYLLYQIFIRFDLVAVAVQQSQANCQCRQSVFIMTSHSSPMLEVRCVSRQGIENYKIPFLVFQAFGLRLP